MIAVEYSAVYEYSRVVVTFPWYILPITIKLICICLIIKGYKNSFFHSLFKMAYTKSSAHWPFW